jgi:hypothetical protein
VVFADYSSMSISPLAFESLLPAAAKTVGEAARAATALGGNFLHALSAASGNLLEAAPTLTDAANSAVDEPPPSPALPDSVRARTETWCQRLLGWLHGHGFDGNLTLAASLSPLDQPQITASGPEAEALTDALSRHPDLMSEFRELALDASSAMEPEWTRFHSGPFSHSPPPTLIVDIRDQSAHPRWTSPGGTSPD